MREIVEMGRFRLELETIISDHERADEFLDGTKINLALNPGRGLRLVQRDGAEIYVVESNIPDLDLKIYYTFDDQAVYLLSIQF